MKKYVITLLSIGCVLSSQAQDSQFTATLAEGESYPAYYSNIEHIVLKDVMTRYFETSDTGILSYGLEDLAKAEGHVCAAVAGAFLMAREGLKALAESYQNNPTPEITSSYDYNDKIFYRGGIKVTMSGKKGTGGAANAMGAILAFITGANDASGFSRGPDFPFANRRNLFMYDPELAFNPREGVEAIFTSMTTSYTKKNDKGETVDATFAECDGTWGECMEKTTCDKSVKVTYKFIGNNAEGKSARIKYIIDNYDKAITVEAVDNPVKMCAANTVSNVSGVWYDPDYNGSGFNFINTNGGLYAYFYGYKGSGNGIAQWLVTDKGPQMINKGKSYQLNVFSGFPGNGGSFTAKPTSGGSGVKPWGTMTVAFDNCTKGTITLEGQDGSVTHQIEKLASDDNASCFVR